MSSKPHNEQSPSEIGRCSETNGLDITGLTISKTRQKYKIYRREFLKGLIRDWAMEGKLSPDAAQKALEFIRPQLVRA